jgi:hypothetical protein
MGLFDGQPLTVDEIRARLVVSRDGPTIRKMSDSGKVYTVRHAPWWTLLGPGPTGYTCGSCHWLKAQRFGKTYFKCGRQLITRGPGTDIRRGDDACRLWHLRGVSMFTVKRDE